MNEYISRDVVLVPQAQVPLSITGRIRVNDMKTITTIAGYRSRAKAAAYDGVSGGAVIVKIPGLIRS